MSERLAGRILELFGPMRDEDAAAAAKVAVTRRYRTVPGKLAERQTRFAEADFLGWQAGGKVDLNRGVGASDKAAGLLE